MGNNVIRNSGTESALTGFVAGAGVSICHAARSGQSGSAYFLSPGADGFVAVPLKPMWEHGFFAGLPSFTGSVSPFQFLSLSLGCIGASPVWEDFLGLVCLSADPAGLPDDDIQVTTAWGLALFLLLPGLQFFWM